MIITIIIMNMQKNLYTIQFFSPPNDLLSLLPDVLTPQGIAKSPGPEAVLHSLLLLVR